jgi:hypothetical protein
MSDKEAPPITKDLLDDLKEACGDRASADALIKNKIFIALVNYFDEMEENDYAAIRGDLSEQQTYKIRGRLSYLKAFREFVALINQR